MCTLKMSESPKSLLFSLLFILLFNERAGMRRRSRGRKPAASRLHRYGLQEREGVSMQATSDAHVGASLRVSRKDLLRLEGRKAGRACEEGPIVALFSTGGSGEAVSLASSETMRVRLPQDDDAQRGGRSAAAPVAPQRGPVGPQRAPSDAAEWEKLVVVAHAQYTGGMRVSGIIHRALVWLEWE
jgi:hypothetical protein